MSGEDFVAEEPMECELSPRELQILRTAARVMGNKEVANTVPLSDTIIKRNTSSDYGKLDVNSRGEAVSKAVSESWVSYWNLARDE